MHEIGTAPFLPALAPFVCQDAAPDPGARGPLGRRSPRPLAEDEAVGLGLTLAPEAPPVGGEQGASAAASPSDTLPVHFGRSALGPEPRLLTGSCARCPGAWGLLLSCP